MIVAGYARKTVYVVGMFGGGAVALELSPDPGGSVWATASDRHGTRLSGLRSPCAELVAEHASLLRPRATAGIDSVAVWVVLSA